MNVLRASFASSALLLIPSGANALTNLYSTHFERAEGYDTAYELAGQQGWVCDTSSLGGNGLFTNSPGNQVAYVGLFPLDPLVDSISVWQPINYAPALKQGHLVKFSVLMSIIDSTTTNRDDFQWSVYNVNGDRLFTIDLYNLDLGIYYRLDGTNDFQPTGLTFSNDVVYTLGMTMDFALEKWAATLNGTLLVTNLPMSTTGLSLSLGDIDAVWAIPNIDAPGDDFMFFDNYQITAEPSPAATARLSIAGWSTRGAFLLHLAGSSGLHYAIDAATNWQQWTALKTNTVTDGSFDYIDTAASAFSKRFYRARFVP
jgi:hypothetical protein